MKNKIIIGSLLLIVLISIGYIVYDKVLKEKEIVLNEELDGLVSFATINEEDSTKLVAIANSGEVVLYEKHAGDSWIGTYNYSEGKLYFFLDGYILSYIDLTQGDGNYEIKRLYEDENTSAIRRLTISNHNVYFYAYGAATNYKFDVLKNKISKISFIPDEKVEDTTFFAIANDDEKMILNSENKIYSYNIETKKTTSLLEGTVRYVHNDEIVYSGADQYIGNDPYPYCTYYLYNLKDDTTKILAPIAQSLGYLMIPYEDAYFYGKNHILYKFENDKLKEMHDFGEDIGHTQLISANKMLVVTGTGEDAVSKYYIYDLKEGTTTSTSESNIYTDLIYID